MIAHFRIFNVSRLMQFIQILHKYYVILPYKIWKIKVNEIIRLKRPINEFYFFFFFENNKIFDKILLITLSSSNKSFSIFITFTK